MGMIKIEAFRHLTFSLNDKAILMGGKHVIKSFIRECNVMQAQDCVSKHDFVLVLNLEYFIY